MEELLSSGTEIDKSTLTNIPDELVEMVAGGSSAQTDLPCPDCGTPMVKVWQMADWALFCPTCGGNAKDGWWNYPHGGQV